MDVMSMHSSPSIHSVVNPFYIPSHHRLWENSFLLKLGDAGAPHLSLISFILHGDDSSRSARPSSAAPWLVTGLSKSVQGLVHFFSSLPCLPLQSVLSCSNFWPWSWPQTALKSTFNPPTPPVSFFGCREPPVPNLIQICAPVWAAIKNKQTDRHH